MTDPISEKGNFFLAKTRNNLAEVLQREGEYDEANELFRNAMQGFQINHDNETAASVANKLAIVESFVTYDEPLHGAYLDEMLGTYNLAIDMWSFKVGSGPLDGIKAKLRKLRGRHFDCDRYLRDPRQNPEEREACALVPEAYDEAIEAVSAHRQGLVRGR